jgi:hypothetical protein
LAARIESAFLYNPKGKEFFVNKLDKADLEFDDKTKAIRQNAAYKLNYAR